MGIMDSVRRFGSKVARSLGMHKAADAVAPTEAAPKKSASMYPRFMHVSKVCEFVPVELRKLLGIKTPYLVSRERGVTYNYGRNQLKRHADMIGANNKQRRRVRSAMRRRFAEIMEEQRAA